ncbi:hypothetical protein CPT_Paso_007 [Rhizobium phage Paso]|uniref:Uncharacterized protein n=1 Tax=Rhizobium phage Paso TaxID=2767574 RepID=A0A7L8G4N1_9CAUD|nr:hypothetical protein CPT_Paso_007 [Rhizobium phage Paso]
MYRMVVTYRYGRLNDTTKKVSAPRTNYRFTLGDTTIKQHYMQREEPV